MNYLKQFGKIVILPAVFLFIFIVFGNTIVFADNVGDKCGAGSKGICRYPSSVNDGCDPDKERKSGECSSYSVQLNCCVPKETPPADNSDCLNLQCGNAHGQCFPNSCGDLEEKGTCTGTPPGGGKNVCCLPKNCAATNPATPSSGSASLEYTPLENLPGFEGEGGDFATYFKNVYLLALWIVGISALFMLVVGGFLYLSSAGNTSTLGYAKKTIYGALIGLVIALISWLLLNTINADLTNLKLSGLSGAIGTNANGVATSGNEGKAPPAGSVESCKSMKTQVSTSQCDDASTNLLGALQCMDKELGGRMTLSSISDSSGFKKCQDSWTDAGCAHAQNSCHYGGKGKYPKSCAADISRSSGTVSDTEFRAAAKKCNVSHFDIHGSPVAHVHISTSECDCDNNLPSP